MRTMLSRQATLDSIGKLMVRTLILFSLTLLFRLSACSPHYHLPIVTSSSRPISPVPSLPSPIPSVTASPECLAIPGKIESSTISTTNLPNPLRFKIYLPPCYAERMEKGYPVLYLFHGQTYDENQWVRIGVPPITDRLIASGEISPFIIVMPYDPYWKQPNEYKFADAVTENLIPYIDSTYRTLADRYHRTVGGLSRGGGWALHLGLTRSDLFGAIGAHAPVIFSTDGSHVEDWLAALPPDQMPRIYLDIDENDQDLAAIRLLEDMLTAANVPHEWHLFTGYHDEDYWSAHVEEYLRWYAVGW